MGPIESNWRTLLHLVAAMGISWRRGPRTVNICTWTARVNRLYNYHTYYLSQLQAYKKQMPWREIHTGRQTDRQAGRQRKNKRKRELKTDRQRQTDRQKRETRQKRRECDKFLAERKQRPRGKIRSIRNRGKGEIENLRRKRLIHS